MFWTAVFRLLLTLGAILFVAIVSLKLFLVHIALIVIRRTPVLRGLVPIETRAQYEARMRRGRAARWGWAPVPARPR